MKPSHAILAVILLAILAAISIVEPVKDGPFDMPDDKPVYDENAHRVLRQK